MKKLFLGIIIFLCTALPAFAANDQFKATIIDITDNYIRVEDAEGNRYTIDPSIETKDTSQLNTGDRLIINHLTREDGTESYIIEDFVRSRWIYALIALFCAVVWTINGHKGIKSLINVGITLATIFYFVIPLILGGYSPVLVTVIGGVICMVFGIYFIEGINKKSHAAILSIALSLLIGALLSWFFVKKSSLTGFADESAGILAGIGYEHIKMRGLLLAAIIIGALGVADDVAISQASIVKELRLANPTMKRLPLFQAALRVGRDHTSAVVNTLVLAYVGAAFPLIILISIGDAPFDSLSSILNNEIVATELVRALIGSITIMLVMPISTTIALWLEHLKK